LVQVALVLVPMEMEQAEATLFLTPLHLLVVVLVLEQMLEQMCKVALAVQVVDQVVT
jgi:uncharacterized membrane protein YwaF